MATSDGKRRQRGRGGGEEDDAVLLRCGVVRRAGAGSGATQQPPSGSPAAGASNSARRCVRRTLSAREPSLMHALGLGAWGAACAWFASAGEVPARSHQDRWQDRRAGRCHPDHPRGLAAHRHLQGAHLQALPQGTHSDCQPATREQQKREAECERGPLMDADRRRRMAGDANADGERPHGGGAIIGCAARARPPILHGAADVHGASCGGCAGLRSERHGGDSARRWALRAAGWFRAPKARCEWAPLSMPRPALRCEHWWRICDADAC